jgi:predicted  nucleic acid-binding Zn-ribbon protein
MSAEQKEIERAAEKWARAQDRLEAAKVELEIKEKDAQAAKEHVRILDEQERAAWSALEQIRVRKP